MDYWREIERLALEKEAKPATIKKWRQRGVPWKWQAALKDAAAIEGFTFPTDAFAPRVF